jgi:hypothetical protein
MTGAASSAASPSRSFAGGEPSLVTLRQACEVVDALEPDVRERLVKVFCRYGRSGAMVPLFLSFASAVCFWVGPVRDPDGRPCAPTAPRLGPRCAPTAPRLGPRRKHLAPYVESFRSDAMKGLDAVYVPGGGDDVRARMVLTHYRGWCRRADTVGRWLPGRGPACGHRAAQVRLRLRLSSGACRRVAVWCRVQRAALRMVSPGCA